MKLHNFNSVYSLAQTLYGTNLTSTAFEDIALNGWEKIGNKHTRLYRYKADAIDKKIELPCNCDIIESVHLPLLDAQMTTNQTVFNQITTLFIENYVEAWKCLNNPYYHPGKLVKYHQEDNSLRFDRDYKGVIIIYHGVIVDDEGLPLLNDKEVTALAAYIGYCDLYKQGIALRDKNLIELSELTRREWLRACSAARIPIKFTQNDMDAILDVKTRWDRKSYMKSFKPIL